MWLKHQINVEPLYHKTPHCINRSLFIKSLVIQSLWYMLSNMYFEFLSAKEFVADESNGLLFVCIYILSCTFDFNEQKAYIKSISCMKWIKKGKKNLSL